MKITTNLKKLSQSASNHSKNIFNQKNKFRILFWIGGLFAFLWIILRSGTNPKRLAYPCQRAAFPLASAWFIAIAGILGGTILWKLIARIGIAAVLVLGFGWFMISASSETQQFANTQTGLPVWAVDNPVSNIFVLDNIPTTPGSLAAGDASVPDSHLPDPAMDSLFMIMDSQDLNIYRTSSTPNGLISSDETVVIKGNFQWQRTLSTNTDRIKGLIWKILQHPEGFTGEILVCENHQNSGDADLNLCNNSEDQNQTILDVINTFKAKGYPVDLVLWSEYSDVVVTEFSDGDFTDGYTWNATNMVSYPKFTTPAGTNVSLKFGIWNSSSSSYNRENLCVINFPVAKAHGWVGATIGIKNWLGTLTAAHANSRYGGSDAMHCDYWFDETALPARVMAEAYPDLTIVDATWVAPMYNHIWGTNNQIRMDILVASTDPVASSYYTAKYVLNPVADSDRRTDPDNTDNSGTCGGFNIPYSVVFSNWTNYLINTAGMNYTRDTLEMSVYSRESLSNTAVTSITVSSEGDLTSINTMEGTLQLYANILPTDATNKSVTWSVNNTSLASISQNGVLTAADNGVVTATATANDGSGISGDIEITITNQNPVLVTSISVRSEGNSTEIATDGGTLQMYADILPANATNKSVTWAVNNQSIASIDQEGLLTALDDGTLIVTATANDGSNESGNFEVTISNQNTVPVSFISLITEGNSTEITEDEGTLQIYAQILPENATNKSVTWSVDNSDIATINQSGVLQAIDDGTVTVTGTANDGSNVSGNISIDISNQNLISVNSIVVSSEGNATSITDEGGTLQMYATVLPNDATDKSVTWSVSDVSVAEINQDGLLTAYSNGTVVITASANDGSGVSGELSISVSNQNPIPVSEITITSEGDATTITVLDGTLQLYAGVAPGNATNKSVTWSVNNAYNASINSNGLLTAINDGTVTATATANDGSGVFGNFEVEISNQNPVPVSQINITSETGATVIDKDGGTLTLLAQVLPANATDNSLTWSVNNPAIAGISQAGMMIAYDNGDVTAIATANDGSGITGEFDVTISNQNLVLITGITLTPEGNNYTIEEKGGQLQIYATIAPSNASNKSVTWSVNNQSIATIDDTGLLTAINDGEIVVSAQANDGSGVFNTITIDISNQAYVPVDDISVYSEGNQYSIIVDKGQLQLFASVSPQNATNAQIEWSTDKESIATIDSQGLLAAQSNGFVKAYASSMDNPEIIDSISIEIRNQISSISKNFTDKYYVYPNPSNGKFFIQQKGTEELSYSVYDLKGKVVFSKSSCENLVEVDGSILQAGIYIIKISNNKSTTFFKKIIIEH